MLSNIEKLQNATAVQQFNVSGALREDLSPSQILEIWRELVGEPSEVRLGRDHIMRDGNEEMITYNLYSLFTVINNDEYDGYQPSIGMIVRQGRAPIIKVFSGMFNVSYCLNLNVWGEDSVVTLNTLNKSVLRPVISALKTNIDAMITEHVARTERLKAVTYNQETYGARYLHILGQLADIGLEELIVHAVIANKEKYNHLEYSDYRIFETLTDTLKRFSPAKLLENTLKIQSLFFDDIS